MQAFCNLGSRDSTESDQQNVAVFSLAAYNVIPVVSSTARVTASICRGKIHCVSLLLPSLLHFKGCMNSNR